MVFEFFANRFASLAYNAFVKTTWLRELKPTSSLWERAWARSKRRFTRPVTTVLHGVRARLPYGHAYPIYARMYRTYNNPLIELVYQAHNLTGSELTLIDVGSNIGDTVLLIEANCPGIVQRYYCIEGDTEYFTYLRANLGHLTKVKPFMTFLSSSDIPMSSLVRTSAGTASAQGSRSEMATSLDSLLMPTLTQVEILKIDVDGLDGEVLKGAKAILQKYHPAVIFEWHPLLCKRTNNSFTEHFDVLLDAGYSTFAWYDKYGNFSHFMKGLESGSLEMLADLCLRNSAYYDLHFDVIALHRDSRISPISLSELSFARSRQSFY